MRITVGNPEFVLSDHNSTAPADLRIVERRLTQVTEFVRAVDISTFDRKNKQTTITFSVTRQHASIRGAGVYMLEHATKLPNRGLVTIEARDTNGSLTRRYLKNAMISSVESRQLGVSTFHSYEIVGGQMLTTKPT